MGSRFDERLEELEPDIRAAARRLYRSNRLYGVEDLEQVGRMEAMRLLRSDAVVNKSYILQRVSGEMRTALSVEHRHQVLAQRAYAQADHAPSAPDLLRLNASITLEWAGVQLSRQERRVIYHRYYGDRDPKEVALKMSLTRRRVEQLTAQALQKYRRKVT